MTAPQVEPCARSIDDIDTCHIFCCHDENLALCGEDLTDTDWDEDNPNVCIVCDELDLAESCSPPGLCICPCCVAIPTEVSP